MKSNLTTNGFFLAAAALTLSVAAIAGQAQPKAKTVRGGESGLVGIKLYDTGTRVITVYGNPNEIQPVGFGGGAIGPAAGGGGMGGPGGPPAGARGPMRGGAAGGGGAGATAALPITPGEFGFGDEMLGFQRGPRGGLDVGEDGGASGGAGAPQVGPGLGGPPPGAGAPGGGGGMGAGGNTGKILYTRWIYRRGPSKYGFILDKYNRVVQVEAIGMSDSRVRTSKGVRFGSTFGDIMKRYQTPDGYEINGDNIVVRYLVRNKVAFRLSRLGENKPHVVTGIVVAGGKT